MLVEGLGQKAPAPIRIPVTIATTRLLRNVAEERERRRGYAWRQDPWKRGFVKSPTLVGLVGEHAFCEHLTQHGFRRFVDLAWRPLGDGGRDVEVCGLRCQVKTRRRNVSGCGLVRRGTAGGTILPLACDVFVFAQWCEEDIAHPLLLGWQWAKAISQRVTFERSPLASANHWNLNVADAFLLPMCRFIDELVVRRERGA